MIFLTFLIFVTFSKIISSSSITRLWSMEYEARCKNIGVEWLFSILNDSYLFFHMFKLNLFNYYILNHFRIKF